MTVVWDEIYEAHKADAFPVKISYSRDSLKAETIKQAVKQSGIVRYIQPAPLPVGNILRQSTRGDVKVVQGFMLVFAATAKECVKALEDWFIRVGCVSQSGIVGLAPNGPWTYSTLSLLSYDPIGDVEQYAEPYGEVYAIEQYVRISIA